MQHRNEFLKVFWGLLILLGMHIIFTLALLLIINLLTTFAASSRSNYQAVNQINVALSLSFLLIGVTQLLYVIPTLLRLRRRREWGLFKGVVIGAVITALLCGGCWLAYGNLINL